MSVDSHALARAAEAWLGVRPPPPDAMPVAWDVEPHRYRVYERSRQTVQLNPADARYYGQDEARDLLRSAGVGVELNHRHGYSGTVIEWRWCLAGWQFTRATWAGIAHLALFDQLLARIARWRRRS